MKPHHESLQTLFDNVARQMPQHGLVPTMESLWREPLESILEMENAKRRKRSWQLRTQVAQDTDWTAFLTAKQHANLQNQRRRYVKKYGHEPDEDHSCIFDLGQTAAWTKNSHGLPTLRTTSSGPLWSPWKRRWLTKRERAAAMGFPVFPDLARKSGVTVCEEHLGPGRVGNAMHVASVGVAFAIAVVAGSADEARP